MTPFSVLMSAYQDTHGGELESCLESIAAQSVPPDEIVLIYDGPVRDEIRAQVERHRDRLNIRALAFAENRGLGFSLQDGLAACRNPLVARMDTDDICLPGRFERQMKFLERNPDVSVLGGHMVEQYGDKSYVRRLPLDPEAIRRYARFRNPLNHPTVMFRREDVEAAGGYQPMPGFEDYYLWVRMLRQGFRIANLDEPLVRGGADGEFFARRGGYAYLRRELNFAGALRRMAYHGGAENALFIVMRLPFRLAPVPVREWMYRSGLRQMGNHANT